MINMSSTITDSIFAIIDKKYPNDLNDSTSTIFKIFSFLATIDESDENYYVFYEIFNGLVSNDFTIDDITIYLNNQNLSINISSLKSFIINLDNTITYDKLNYMFQKIFNGTFQNFIEGNIITALKNTYKDILCILYPNDYYQNKDHWLLTAKIAYYEPNSFFSIVDAEKAYLDIIDNQLYPPITFTYNIIDNIIKKCYNKLGDSDYPYSVFLYKPASKLSYFLDTDDNNLLIMILRKEYESLSIEEIYYFLNQMIKNLIIYTDTKLINDSSYKFIYKDDKYMPDLLGYAEEYSNKLANINPNALTATNIKEILFYNKFILPYVGSSITALNTVWNNILVDCDNAYDYLLGNTNGLYNKIISANSNFTTLKTL